MREDKSFSEMTERKKKRQRKFFIVKIVCFIENVLSLARG